MGKKFIGILITVIMCFSMAYSAMAQGFPNKPDVTDFSYTLKNKMGVADTAITSGGSLEVKMTLENNTAVTQPYIISLQILNNEKKVSLKAARGELAPSGEEIICLSDGFSETETDFSKYSAEVYVWSDMDSMQPISTYSVFGSDNNDIYAYKIDNNDLVYTKNNTFLSHYFAKTYSGTPVITPIFRDLASKYTVTPSIQEVTSDSQNLNFKVTSQAGTQKDYYLEIYRVTDANDPKNADLKSITLPMGTYNTSYNGKGHLYPAFNKDVTEYTVFTYMKSYAGLNAELETVNSDATVTLTTAPDTSLENTCAVYTVTSADGTVTKDYKINYIANEGTSLSITALKNFVVSKSGRDLWSWNYTTNVWNYENIVIEDGKQGSATVMDTCPIIEIDISAGPSEIKHGILTLSNIRTITDAIKQSGTLKVYKINDSIYDVNGGLTSIGEASANDYFADEICSVSVVPRTSGSGDMYYINIGANYYNSLKAAGREKMYIGLAGEAADSSKAMGIVFGQGGTGKTNSRFNYITE